MIAHIYRAGIIFGLAIGCAVGAVLPTAAALWVGVAFIALAVFFLFLAFKAEIEETP